eukprot:3128710-Ditylum_brightwellii.AAC.1
MASLVWFCKDSSLPTYLGLSSGKCSNRAVGVRGSNLLIINLGGLDRVSCSGLLCQMAFVAKIREVDLPGTVDLGAGMLEGEFVIVVFLDYAKYNWFLDYAGGDLIYYTEGVGIIAKEVVV